MRARDAELQAQLESLAANIKRLRARLGLSQEAFAEHAGLDYGWVQKLERAAVDLRLQTLVRISKALGATPSQLLRKAKLPTPRPGRPRQRLARRT